MRYAILVAALINIYSCQNENSQSVNTCKNIDIESALHEEKKVRPSEICQKMLPRNT